ncbi:MAG: hypothetical protein WBL63_04820 [Candidatus Acidiferrum sp.]
MDDPLILRDLSWAITTMLEVVLSFYLLRRRLNRSHPIFFSYILATILQSLVVAFAYWRWGSQSMQSWNIFWGSQGAVVCLRWLAIAEIAREILATYSGIWRLADRLLFLAGIGVLVYSVLSMQNSWQWVVLNADRGVELAIAVILVSLLLFARYYRVPIAGLERYLIIGFCLYSCFWVVNDTLFARWPRSLVNLWGFLDTITFFATLMLWIRAVRAYTETERVTAYAPVSPEAYAQLSLEVNARLRLLNDRLNHLLRVKDSRS